PLVGEHVERVVDQSGGVGWIVEVGGGEVGEQDGALLGRGGREAGECRGQLGGGRGAIACGQGAGAGEAVKAGGVVEVEPVGGGLCRGDALFGESDPALVAGCVDGPGDRLGGDAVQPGPDEWRYAVPAVLVGGVGEFQAVGGVADEGR